MLMPKTAVMNYTEMEAKVREATNNEPWGRCCYLSVDNAIDRIQVHRRVHCRKLPTEPLISEFFPPGKAESKADRNSQLLNEIMPMIYKRFTEKASEEWRQIYKVC